MTYWYRPHKGSGGLHHHRSSRLHSEHGCRIHVVGVLENYGLFKSTEVPDLVIRLKRRWHSRGSCRARLVDKRTYDIHDLYTRKCSTLHCSSILHRSRSFKMSDDDRETKPFKFVTGRFSMMYVFNTITDETKPVRS